MSNYKRGDKVAILSTLDGRVLVESRNAKIVRHYRDGYYFVRLGSEQALRFVNEAAQDDPDGFVAALNAQGNPGLFTTLVRGRRI